MSVRTVRLKLIIDLPGEPVAKQRARKGRYGFYTPNRTVAYEKAIGWAGVAAMKGRKPLMGPLRMIVQASFSVPMSWSKQDKAGALAGLIRPTSKPDWDNLGKILSDGLNGIAYLDDAQIVTATVSKVYAAVPNLHIEIEPLFDNLQK